MKPNFTIQEVESLKEENKKLRLELQQAGITSETDDFYIPDREDFTPKSNPVKIESASPSRESSKNAESAQYFSPIKDISTNPNSEIQTDEIVSKKICKHCKLYLPCVHQSLNISEDSKPFQSENMGLSRQTRMHQSTNSTLVNSELRTNKSPEMPIKLNVRYRVTNYIIEDPAAAAQLKEEENKKKEMQNIRYRLNKINEIESYRKEQFKNELRMLEENKKNEEEEAKKKQAEDAKRKKILEEKKKKVEEFKKNKQFSLEIDKMRMEEIKKAAEIKRTKKNEAKKKKLLEYYNKRQTEARRDDNDDL